MNSPTGQTRRQIFTLDGSNDADSRKDVPFGGFVDIAPHFRFFFISRVLFSPPSPTSELRDRQLCGVVENRL